MDSVQFDLRMMVLALATARRGLGQTAPNPAVGAVLANPETGEVLARGATAKGGRPHAETEVLARAGAQAQGATLYVTLEPCAHHGQSPPCVEQIIAAGIARVVVGVQDPDKRVAGQGLARLRAAGIPVQSGICGPEALWLTLGHIRRVCDQRPFVQLKLAMDCKGEVPRGDAGQPRFVTSPLSRSVGHLMRAEADAILIGGATLRDDDPALTCRLPGLADRSPIRIVVTSKCKHITGSALIASRHLAPLWFAYDDGSGTFIHEDCNSVQESGGPTHGTLHLRDVLRDLAERGVTRLLVEGGPQIWQWFAQSGFVDEIVAFIGGLHGHGADAGTTAQTFVKAHLDRDPGAVLQQRSFGNDGCFTFRPNWAAE